MGQIIDMTFLSTIKTIGAAHGGKPILVIGRTTGAAAAVIKNLRSIGARFRVEEGLYQGLSEVAVDPNGWSLVIVVADDLGGLSEAKRAFGWIRTAAPALRTLIVSAQVERHQIPDGDRSFAPVILRAPVSLLSLQLGIDTVLRDCREVPVPAFA